MRTYVLMLTAGNMTAMKGEDEMATKASEGLVCDGHNEDIAENVRTGKAERCLSCGSIQSEQSGQCRDVHAGKAERCRSCDHVQAGQSGQCRECGACDTVTGEEDETMLSQKTIEEYFGVHLLRGWHLDGAGPARYGYELIAPAKTVWLGPTLQAVACALFARGGIVDADRAAEREGWHDVASLLRLRAAGE